MPESPSDPLQRPVLPGDSKVAVTFSFALEAWTKPPLSKMALTAEFPREAVERGIADRASESWYAYGLRTGFPRLRRTIEALDVPATIAVSGIIAEQRPELMKSVVNAGHELIGHGYSQDRRMFLLSAQEQFEEVARCKAVIEEASGVAPVGWSSQAGQRGDNTVEALLAEDFVWTNDFRDADTPYVVASSGGRRLIAMPRTDALNDAVLFKRHGQPPSVYVEVFKRTFDQLVDESHLGLNVITPVFHPTYFGHPLGASALRECVQYAKESGVAWLCRRRDVAELYRKATDPAPDST